MISFSFFLTYKIGSNCIMIEKGKIPPYSSCLGCEVQQAMNCLNDLRTNASGTVQVGCKLGYLNEVYDSSCCPKYILKKKKILLKYETSAYPIALSCLRNIGCQDTQVNQKLNNIYLSLFFCHFLFLFFLSLSIKDL